MFRSFYAEHRCPIRLVPIWLKLLMVLELLGCLEWRGEVLEMQDLKAAGGRRARIRRRLPFLLGSSSYQDLIRSAILLIDDRARLLRVKLRMVALIRKVVLIVALVRLVILLRQYRIAILHRHAVSTRDQFRSTTVCIPVRKSRMAQGSAQSPPL